jgi:ATP-binding cassette, subfamily B, bacterial MsbA
VIRLKSTLSSPAYRLLIATAAQNWILLAFNLFTNFLSAFLEGSTLGIIYLAVSVLATKAQQSNLHPILVWVLSVTHLSSGILFLALLGVAVTLQIFLSLCNYGNHVSSAYFSARAQPQVTGQVFAQIMSFSFAHASKYKVGDLVLYANSAASTINTQVQLFNNLLVSITFTTVYAVILINLSPILAMVAVVLAIIVIALQRQILPRLRKLAASLNVAQVELAEQMTESIQALRLLHTFGTQTRATTKITSLLEKNQEQLQERAKIFYLTEPILDVLPIFALAVLAGLAYLTSSSPDTILPLLVTFLLSLQRLSVRMRGVASGVIGLTDNSAKIQRLNSILTISDKEFSLVGGEQFASLQTDICFDGVTLSYASDDSLALHDLTFSIPKNQVTALVGQSGAGKSSIIDLLVGLYQTTSGQITVNGQSLQSYNQSSWQKHIGVVSQDTFIFNRTILENLRYGAPEATDEEVIEAAKAAQAHQFILDLPDGYETVVGERGYRLSGGQRQRLALARAIVKQPEILILDEATSALDSESERLIQQALTQFQKNRTVIVIAHRLSTIVDADQILVFEKGELLETGNHKTLMQKRGRYAHYWSLQTQGVTV